MEALLNEIKAAVSNEYNRAAAIHGPSNHSAHESYGIILEEYEEAQEKCSAFSSIINHYWHSVKADAYIEHDSHLTEMQEFAERAAAEWVQVAAMCYKARQEG